MKSLLSLFSIIFFISVSADDYKILTSSGITEGFINNRVVVWNDIPYAKPPLGDLRWKAPRKIEQNSNLIEPMEGNFCIQRTSILGGSSQFSNDQFLVVRIVYILIFMLQKRNLKKLFLLCFGFMVEGTHQA